MIRDLDKKMTEAETYHWTKGGIFPRLSMGESLLEECDAVEVSAEALLKLLVDQKERTCSQIKQTSLMSSYELHRQEKEHNGIFQRRGALAQNTALTS